MYLEKESIYYLLTEGEVITGLLMYWSSYSSKTATGQPITLKKHVTLMSCTLQATIQSGLTGQRIHNMDVLPPSEGLCFSHVFA